MHDAIVCSELGMPATALYTEPFRTLAKLTCANAGVPDFTTMAIGHPLFTRDDAWIEATAVDLAERVTPLLFGGSKEAGTSTTPLR